MGLSLYDYYNFLCGIVTGLGIGAYIISRTYLKEKDKLMAELKELREYKEYSDV